MVSYQSWLWELKERAKALGVDLMLSELNYHTYYYRGWSVSDVIDDIVSEGQNKLDNK